MTTSEETASRSADLLARLICHDARHADDTHWQEKLRRFLHDTGTVKDNELPTVNQLYKDTAKLVDTFNATLGTVSFGHRSDRWQIAFFRHTIKIVAANAWVLYLDQKPHDSEDISFGDFMREISLAILDPRESR
ncbi:hypothetical protein PROFUN_11224 [Planoprotostelium fungivorum]|uniref:Uncharacterized protein n=1 Tax=Planoprotostelium fungivorum TaxID=1890364 RepID=A0A2P6NA49_9EUKA|nr:hypothetical protein PROFUN_11224 [Planoprotostelium fungivorum]